MAVDYGRRLIPTILQHEAKINPQRIFAILAKSNDIKDGFDNISFRQVSRAANYLSCWLQDRFENGNPPDGIPTLGYMGGPDLCYTLICYAAMQCRYKIFLPSPRNPTSTNTALMRQTKCTRFVYTDQVTSTAAILQEELAGLHCEKLPSLETLLDLPHSDYNYDLTYDQIYRNPAVILHSSGSTGLPKTITFTYGTMATWDVRDWPNVPGRVNHDSFTTIRLTRPDSRFYDVFPLFHLAGFLRKVLAPVYIFAIPILGPPSRPPSGVLAAEILRTTNARGAVLPPSIVEQLYRQPDSETLFKQLDFLLYSGGPLPDSVGSKLCHLTKVCQMYGSTEIGQIRQLAPLPDDWAYLEFHPHEKFDFREAADGLFELVMLSGPELERTSALYHNFPEVREYRTRDLFEPHPNKSGLWKFKARNDDILVFSSGEKLNPLPFELSLAGAPGVSGALVVGQGRSRSALLLEVADSADLGDAIQVLWPAIEAANKILPTHGRILKSMVIISTSTKPFPRAGKGSVIRRMTEKLYEHEIQQLYASSERQDRPLAFTLKPSAFRLDDIESLIRSILDQFSISPHISRDANIYENGMDSITTAEAVAHLRASLQIQKPHADMSWLTSEIVYLHPTISSLASLLLHFLNEDKVYTRGDEVASMEAKIAKYTQRLPSLQPLNNADHNVKWNVAVTGTTGFLGSYILRQLVVDSRVSCIYCLNRSSSALERFESLKIVHDKEIVFMQIDFSTSKLGLKSDEYDRILNDCDLIIHNAWRVDFNLSLDSFDDHLGATRHLIDLSAESKIRPRIVFISSIASAGVFSPRGSPRKVVPEDIVSDLNTATERGYGRAKRVAEHILSAAALQSNTPVSILRVGQIVPSDDGVWPDNDIIPVFLKTCKESEKLASDFLEKIDWVPVHQVAKVVIDLAQYSLEDNMAPKLQVYNIVNPHPRPWTAVLGTVQKWCGGNVKVMSMKEWVDAMREEDADDPAQLARLPALKVFKSFEQMLDRGPYHDYAMNNLLAKAGKSMHQVEAISNQQLATWLEKL